MFVAAAEDKDPVDSLMADLVAALRKRADQATTDFERKHWHDEASEMDAKRRRYRALHDSDELIRACSRLEADGGDVAAACVALRTVLAPPLADETTEAAIDLGASADANTGRSLLVAGCANGLVAVGHELDAIGRALPGARVLRDVSAEQALAAASEDSYKWFHFAVRSLAPHLRSLGYL